MGLCRTCSVFRVHAFGEARAQRSSAIHFQGRSIRQVSRYTLLSGCQLPWPSTCCLYRSTPFVGSDERRVERLVSAFGSSRITSPAYQEWPTRLRLNHSPPAAFFRLRENARPFTICATFRRLQRLLHRLPIESSRIGRGLFVPDRSASDQVRELNL